MVEAVNAIGRLPLLLVLLGLPRAVSAHVLDQYVQSTIVTIEPADVRLHVNLTPGVLIADRVIALIDRNHDGMISPDEAAAYAQLLKHDLVVAMDGRKVELKVASCSSCEPGEMRTGRGIIKVEFTVAAELSSAGAHRLSVENRHFSSVGVYLLNAAKPKSSSVRITRQSRNENQSVGEIDFMFRPEASASRAVVIIALLAALMLVGATGHARRARVEV